MILAKIHATFEMQATTAELREKQAEVQGQLCGVLQVILRKLIEEEDAKVAVLPAADSVSALTPSPSRPDGSSPLHALACDTSARLFRR